MAELFGFEIRRKPQEEAQIQEREKSFVPKQDEYDDGAVIVAAGGVYGTYVDLEGSARSEAELVTRYREMAQHPEVDSAVDDIVNEAIVQEPEEPIVQINVDDLKTGANVKKLIKEEFDNVLELLNFRNQSYELFRRWYIDGRMYYHVVIDEKDPRAGIKELRYVDPRRIRKIREVKKKKDPRTQVTLPSTEREYYIYNDKSNWGAGNPNFATGGTTGLRIAKDSILHCTSGLMDKNNSVVLSYLHKAIKPLNQLRTLEDATIIYRVSRAPERRIFYIDVGNLPKMKAEQYLRDMMIRHKNKVVYDQATGEIRDDRKFMTMLEDYWLPRREGNRGTEITTLPAGQNLGEMTDVEYFKKVLLASLNVPASRLNTETAFNVGRSTEITRDEVKFAKFVNRLRARFSHLFLKALEKQLVLKGVITQDDWKEFHQLIRFDYAKDNFFAELKEIDVMKERLSVLQDVSSYAGKYYSHTWIRKNILRQTEEDIEEMDEEIAEEMELVQYQSPEQLGQPGQGPELPPQEQQ